MLRDTLQRPLHDLRVSLTDHCNFRCSYCLPAELSRHELHRAPAAGKLTRDEHVRLIRIFTRLGVRKIRLTGGEPLLYKELAPLISDLREIPEIGDLALTTNGYLLERFAQPLKDAGLMRVNVSLDAMDDTVFGRMNGVGAGVARVLTGIAAAKRAGLDPVKVNMVVKRGVNDQGVMDMVREFRRTGVVLRFIEFMDVGNRNHWRPEDVVPTRDLVRRIDSHYPLTPIGPVRNQVAERYRYADGSGEIGFISSISRPFCGGCDRGRLTSAGQFVTCLFAAGGLDLRTPLRDGSTDTDIRRLIAATWNGRADRYSELRTAIRRNGEVVPEKVEMYQIGG